MTLTLPNLSTKLAEAGYVADRELAMALHFMDMLKRPCCWKAKQALAKPKWPRLSPRRTKRSSSGFNAMKV